RVTAFLSRCMNTDDDVPCWCAPALIRVIQSLRKSRFLFLRSRYAYFQPRSTVSFAGHHSLLRAPNAPRAAFMLCFFRFRRGTFDTERGMVGLRLGLKQTLHVFDFAVRGHETGLAQAGFSVRRLVGQDVALERLVAANLAGARDLEALLRALMGFHFH